MVSDLAAGLATVLGGGPYTGAGVWAATKGGANVIGGYYKEKAALVGLQIEHLKRKADGSCPN